MAIQYSILYPPRVPLTIPAFELGKPEETWRLYLEPSVGNKVSDFKGGFIRIRNSETEKNTLFPGSGGFLDGLLPFRNPFAEVNDLINPDKSIIQPEGYDPTIPFLAQNERGEFYIDIKHETFTLSGSQVNIRYKVAVMFTTDWISSTLPNGRGNISIWNEELQEYDPIDTNTYFSGNLVQKGLSEWSNNTLVSPVSEAKYELLLDGNNIYSSIFEFVGSSVESNIRNNATANYLKAYRINIYRAFGEEKELFIDSSDWIVGQDASNLQIKWQNVVELENKNKYIVELDIQTIWDLRKRFTYHVETSFEASLFQGKVTVENDHDNARSKIKLNVKTPLVWGPKDNFDISLDKFDYATIDGKVTVEQGIDFFNKLGSIAGHMIVSNIKPIRDWDNHEDEYFFKLSGPPLTIHNPIQEEYTIYAHSVPIGREKEDNAFPYEDDIIINPVFESPTGEVYKTYLDSATGTVVTMGTDDPSSHTFFYLEDENNQMWRTTITQEGNFVTEISHEKDPTQYLKPIYLYDSYNEILVAPKVNRQGLVILDDYLIGYKRGVNLRPMFVNEFRFVKRVYALELGRKTLIITQTYKAYLTDYNRKLNNWQEIKKNREYYIYFSSSNGQIRLIVRDLSALDNENSLDRFTMSYIEGISESLPDPGMFLITDGINVDFLPVKDENGDKINYTISSDERGVLVSEEGFIASAFMNVPP